MQIKLPEKRIFNLWEVADNWKEKQSNIHRKDVLNYGAEGLLTIHVSIPKYLRIRKWFCLNNAEYKKDYPVEWSKLSDEQKNQEKFLFEDKEGYKGNRLEPLQKEVLLDIFLNGYSELVCIKYINSGNFLQFYYDNGYRSNSNIIRINDLYVLREDKLAFENRFLEKKEGISESKKQKRKPRYIEGFQAFINYEYKDGTRTTNTELVDMLKNEYSKANPYTPDFPEAEKICSKIYIENGCIYFTCNKEKKYLSIRAPETYFKRASES